MQTLGEFGVKVLLLTTVMALLPVSPFQGLTSLMAGIPYLSYLNWFIPVAEITVIFEAWLAVVAIYYGILYVLNYVGVLKS